MVEIFKDKEIASLKNDVVILAKVVNQIEKDLNLSGINIEVNQDGFDLIDFLNELNSIFKNELKASHSRLKALFYRVDIPEEKWVYALKGKSASEALVVLILKRTLQKIVRRSDFDSIK